MEHVIIFLHLGAALVYVNKAMFREIEVESFTKKCNGLSVVYICNLFKVICPLIMKICHRFNCMKKCVSK